MREKDNCARKETGRIGRREMLGQILGLGAALAALPGVLVGRRRQGPVQTGHEGSFRSGSETSRESGADASRDASASACAAPASEREASYYRRLFARGKGLSG